MSNEHKRKAVVAVADAVIAVIDMLKEDGADVTTAAVVGNMALISKSIIDQTKEKED